jgi:surface-anchored protein
MRSGHTKPEVLLTALLSAGWLMAGLSPAQAGPVLLPPNHFDLEIGYKGGKWELGYFDEDTGTSYPAKGSLALAPPSSVQTVPPGPAFGFLGAPPSSPVWVLPQVRQPGVIWLGFATEELKSGTFAPYFESDPRVNAVGEWIRISLVDARGPGQFSLWQTSPFGVPTDWMSTAEGGITAADAFFIGPEDEAHLNWGFTAPGLYEIDLQASAFLGQGMTDPTSSDVVTFTFLVQLAGGAVPEPASWGLLALGAGGLALVLRPRRRRPRRPEQTARCRVERLEDRAVPSACATTVDLLEEHADIAFNYADGAWSAAAHDHDHDLLHPADRALLAARPSARMTRPPGSEWDFLGIGAGQDVWVLPQTQDPSLLFLGANSIGTAPGVIAPYLETDPRIGFTAPWIRVTLRAVRGPGHFSVWDTTSFGEQRVWMSSFAGGVTGGDAYYMLPGSHAHYNWGFSARGYYEIDLEASAYLGPDQTLPTSSGVVTYYFAAERPGCFSFDPASLSVGEAAGSATLTVRRTRGSDGAVTVDYATGGGSATAGADYTAAAGTLTFADGQTARTFTVPILNDTVVEGSETFNATLSNPTNAALLGGAATAVVTILDDDTGPAVPTITEILVNDGEAQRSRVSHLRVGFSSLVTVDSASLQVRDQRGELVSASIQTSEHKGRTRVNVTFTGGLVGGSLADGNYTLTVTGAGVRDLAGTAVDGDGDGSQGGDRSFVFHRYYGDADGDRYVGDADWDVFSSAYRPARHDPGYLTPVGGGRFAFPGFSGGVGGDRYAGDTDLGVISSAYRLVWYGPGYLAFMDYDGDGTVGDLDFLEFLARWGTTLAP